MSEPRKKNQLLVQDAARLADVEVKHDRVRQLLDQHEADALLLQDSANISWLSAGADLHRCASEDCETSLFVTRDARLFATNSVDSAQIFEREAFGLGFQLKQRDWYEPHSELVSDLCRGRTVLSDRPVRHAKPMRRAIRTMRLPLTALEAERLRTLGHVAVHAIEATGHNLQAGQTEAEVAGEISHRLMKRTVAAARVNVCGDGRNERYRHWTFGDRPIEHYAAISCVARRWGLHVGVTRTVCIDHVPDPLLQSFRHASMVHATGIFFSRTGSRLSDVWQKVQRIYEKFGMASEWQLADQASVIGYGLSDVQLRPAADFKLPASSAMFWHPSVGPAMVGDTILCTESANEQLTSSSTWPRVSVRVKGCEVTCPGILLVGPQRSSSTPEELRPTEVSCPEHPEELPLENVESVWELNVP